VSLVIRHQFHDLACWLWLKALSFESSTKFLYMRHEGQ